MDDAAWEEGEWAGDYVQQLPVEGGEPSQETELKILYDDDNVYMAIRAYDDMDRIARHRARRDDYTGDIVGICFDSYFDKRAGFEFDLTAAGTKIDLVLSNEGWDVTWDAVWDGKVAYEAEAWTAEFRVPLSQLRYGPQDEQVWGMHAWRWIDRLQEESQWTLIARQGTGRLHSFGELRGIRGLEPQRRVELLPHVVGRVESLPDEAGNPYVGDADGAGAFGLDAKIGLTTNFTLDATVNPDFGQVEADPSVVNLTAFETFYEEKRPFFMEGKRILTLGLAGSAIAGDESGTLQGDQLFYSRRIGAPSTVHPVVPDGGFLDSPGETSIISALKVTGKTRNGLSVGLLQSVTAREHANVWLDGVERSVPVAAPTNYLVGRVQKDWSQGNTILGGMFTSTHRWLPDDGELRRLPDDAFTAAVDATRFFADRSYVVEGRAFFSRIAGDAGAIRALQTNPVHYFQRPDADHLGVQEDATSLQGHGGTVRVARYGNSKWSWSESIRWMSPGLELNDVGYLRQTDLVLNELAMGFTETEPRGPFRSFGAGISREDRWDFGGLKTAGTTGLEAAGTFHNLWGLSGGAELVEAPTDTRLLRGGPGVRKSGYVSVRAGLHSDRSRRVSASLSTEHHPGLEADGRYGQVMAGVHLRPANAFNVSVNAFYEHNVDDLEYVATATDAAEPRYILGRLDQETLGLTFRANLFLSPDLTLQYYGSPFVSSGGYDAFKRATSPRAEAYDDRFHRFTPEELTYEPESGRYRVEEEGAAYTFPDPDFDFRQFRSNLVGRWEFRPGSALYVVWTQDRTDSRIFDGSLTDSLDTLRKAPGANVLLVKLSYGLGL
ncbi:MAG: DUF5916 domain-containing protein [Gemmatimonadota bacterium]